MGSFEHNSAHEDRGDVNPNLDIGFVARIERELIATSKTLGLYALNPGLRIETWGTHSMRACRGGDHPMLLQTSYSRHDPEVLAS